jgi:hypothetical protein
MLLPSVNTIPCLYGDNDDVRGNQACDLPSFNEAIDGAANGGMGNMKANNSE